MARSRGARTSTGSQGGPATLSTPVSSARTTKIPLNDDSAEKAKRLKERTLLQSIQKEKMAAAASPARRMTMGSDGSPRTPRNVGMLRGAAASQENLLDAVTPLKRVPILANFEEWMKMATDNKINAANSWNFALIDYFHEMSLLREGDGVNFQKASCTLDGCVKIYTSRVDSVATETGKLLSGLADSSSKKKGRGEDDAEDAEGSEAEDAEGRPKPKRRTQRSSEATLAKDFNQLKAKKFDLELSVDPLFKKACSDFDEGGAKGLLLNHLNIDNSGRIVFDSSDDKAEEALKLEDDDEDNDIDVAASKPAKALEDEEVEDPAVQRSLIASLGAKYFPDLSVLDEQDVCPSLKNFDLGATDVNDLPFMKALEDRLAETANHPANDPDLETSSDAGGDGMAFGFDDGVGFGAASSDDGLGFGEGGEAWANETLADAADRFLSPAKRPILGLGRDGDDQADFDKSASRDFTVGFGGSGHEDILAYFDDALKKNWAGPEHWKIRRIKDKANAPAAAVRPRKEKEAFSIDFLSPEADVPEDILAPPKTLTTIDLPKKDRISKTRHLLPDDKHFNSRQLLRLFLKPKASLSSRRGRGDDKQQQDEERVEMDEEFWAKENMAKEIQASSTPGPAAPTYDANFFADDAADLGLPDPPSPASDDEDIFHDALPMFETPEDLPSDPQQPSSTQLAFLQPGGLKRVRPEYVNYARVAKKVDVRRLKENLWTGLAYENSRKRGHDKVDGEGDTTKESEEKEEDEGEERRFTETMRDLKKVYPEKTMNDISTSYCFICLLHLANEKGLEISGEGQDLQDLVIRKDAKAYGMAEGY